MHAYAASRCGYNSILRLHRMAPDCSSVLDEGKVVFDGHGAHPTIEGPKMYKINQKTPDVSTVKKLLKNLIISPKKATNYKKIINAVAIFYDLKQEEILLPTRRKEIVKPRQIAMYLLREELKESYPSIGRRFQGKDHTTAMYAYDKVSKQIEEDNNLFTEINLIKQRLYSEA